MRRIDTLIINIGAAHTCASVGPKKGAAMKELGTIFNAAIAIEAGLIVEAGAVADLLDKYTARNVIDANGKAVCPGFIDPHTHIVFTGDRVNEFELRIAGKTYMEIMAAGGGIMNSARAVREASVEEITADSMIRLNAMIENGATTVEVKSGYGLNTENELKLLQAIELLAKKSPITIVPTFLGAHVIPSEYKNNPDRYVELVIHEMLPMAMDWYKNSVLNNIVPFFCDVFCELNAFTAEQTIRIFTAATELGFKIKLHSDEFTDLGGVEIGLRFNATSIDHLDVTPERAQMALADSNTVGVTLPGVNFNLGSLHFANARGMIDKGCAIALSTDINPGSSPTPSIPLIMSIASRYQRLMPAETLTAATINSAYAVGMGDVIGSIEAGKRADILILNVTDYRKMIYEFGNNAIKTVIKNGTVIFERDS